MLAVYIDIANDITVNNHNARVNDTGLIVSL